MCGESKPAESYPVAEPYQLAPYGPAEPHPPAEPFQLAPHGPAEPHPPAEPHGQADEPAEDELEYYPLVLEDDELTMCQQNLDQKIVELGELERELPSIRDGAALGFPVEDLSVGQAHARRELRRAEQLQQYLQGDVSRLQTRCTQLRLLQLEMA